MKAPGISAPQSTPTERGEEPHVDDGASGVNLWLDMDMQLTVGELVSLYARDVGRRTLSDATRTSTRSRAAKVLELVIDGEKLAAIGVADLRRSQVLRVQLILADRPAAAIEMIKFLRSAFNWGKQSGLCDRNPADDINLQRPTKTRTIQGSAEDMARHIAITLDVAQALGRPLHWIDFARVLLAQGMRTSEVRTLRHASVNLHTQTMNYVQKGGGIVTAPIVPAVLPALGRRLAVTDDWLWPGRQEGPVSRGEPSRAWKEWVAPLLEDPTAARRDNALTLAELAERSKRTVAELVAWERTRAPRDAVGRTLSTAHLRPTNVTTKIGRGATVKLAGASVGHASERTTERHYIGPLFERLREVAKDMSEIMVSCDQDHKPAPETVARNIKATREGQSMTQAQVAKAVGVSLRTFQGWEKRMGDLGKLEDVANVLGCSVRDLLRGV